MPTQILLIRHAAHGHVGRVLSGRLPGLSLTDEGRAQAAALGRRLAATPLAAIRTSPIERAGATAAAIADAADHPAPVVDPLLSEIDFGEWTGRSFAELDPDPRWQAWNAARSTAAAPGGESAAAATARIRGAIAAVAAEHPDGTVALVTHCDLIRSAVADVLGLTLDHILRFDVAPASITRLEVAGDAIRLLSLNEAA